MTKQEKLIIWYTQRLEKVKAAYAGDWRKDEYIAARAQERLSASSCAVE